MSVMSVYRYARPVRKERKEFHATTLLAIAKSERIRIEMRFEELHELLRVQILKIGRRSDLWEKMKDKTWQTEIKDLCKNETAWLEVMLSVKFMYDEFITEESWKFPGMTPVRGLGEKNYNRAMEMLGLER